MTYLVDNPIKVFQSIRKILGSMYCIKHLLVPMHYIHFNLKPCKLQICINKPIKWVREEIFYTQILLMSIGSKNLVLLKS